MKHLTRYLGLIVLTLAFATVATASCPVFKVLRGSFSFTEPIICVRVAGGVGSGFNLCIYDCGSGVYIN